MGEAVRHSVYVLNRLPTRALSGETPYEAWTGNKPDIGYIREPGTKACRLYDPESEKIHVSRDVVFEEGKSWVWDEQQQENSMSLGYFTVSDLCIVEIRSDRMDDESYTPGESNNTESSSGGNMNTNGVSIDTGESYQTKMMENSPQTASSRSSSEPRNF